MANKKISELDPVTSLENTDLIPVVTDLDTTPKSNKITWTSFKSLLATLFETLSNKVTSFQETPTDAAYPSEKLVKDSLDAKAPLDSPLFTTLVSLANNIWLRFVNYAGTDYLNALKGTTSNELELGTTLNTGTIEAEEDSGAISLFDMAVSSASADGTEMSATIKIDGNNILKIYAESDGAGGADTFKVQLLNKAVLTMQDSAGTTHTYTADTDGSLIIS